MVDALQIVVVVIVIFVLILASEIFFSFCRLYHWIKRKIHGQSTDQSIVPPGRYRRTSVSHDWSDASVLSEDQVYLNVQQQQQQQQQHETATTSSFIPFQRRGSHAVDRTTVSDVDRRSSHHGNHCSRSSSFKSESYGRRFSTNRLCVNDGLRNRRRSHSTGMPNDKILQASDFVKAMKVEWATGHFVCNHCKSGLSGHRYILHEDNSYCKLCYEQLYANICDHCKTPITCEYKDLSCKNRHWHDKCFRCTGCQSSLMDRSFAYKDHNLYCATCYESRFASRCTLCANIFRAGMKKYEHRGKQWHAECFCCKVCQKLIGTGSFIPRGNDIVCISCYEKELTQDCHKCNKAITSGGVVYKGITWHKECFQCNNCSKSLGSEKYTSVNDKVLCSLCYCSLHAPKCAACVLPISGLDVETGSYGPTYISYDERQWHRDCFRCGKCKEGLMGRGFMTEEQNIFCPNCCKEDVEC